jgi:hypothetical protein
VGEHHNRLPGNGQRVEISVLATRLGCQIQLGQVRVNEIQQQPLWGRWQLLSDHGLSPGWFSIVNALERTPASTEANSSACVLPLAATVALRASWT